MARKRSKLKLLLRALSAKYSRAKKSTKLIMLGSACAVFLLTVILITVPKPPDEEAAEAVFANAPNRTDVIEIVPPTPPPPTPTPDPTLMMGCEDCVEVKALQERLMELGYIELDETTLHFGPATKQAVSLFQRQHGLQQDGVAGPETLALIYKPDAAYYEIREGMSGTDVESIQLQLKDMGYLTASVTGYYGTETTKALKAFQERNSLTATGEITGSTLDMLFSPDAKVSATLQKAKRTKANIDEMINAAKSKLGKKYVLGTSGPDRFDCSGLVYYCLRQAGSNRSRYNAAGYSKVDDWEKITKMSNLKRGDLIFFYDNKYSKVGHVGIVIGGGKMIDASSNHGEVVTRSYNEKYWQDHFVCGRRPW